MKNIQEILQNINMQKQVGECHLPIVELCLDSRACVPNSLFVAVVGNEQDGHAYIQTAINNGAIVIVCSTMPNELNEKVTYIHVKNTQEIVGVLASNFYDNPSSKLNLIGITGTNGKTTCATLLYKLFTKLGNKVGLISTIQNQIGDEIIASTHTTPDAISLQKLLSKMAEAGCKYVFMEVSSHAIHQQRIAGAHFCGAMFTNISHDHLDYHKTFEEYMYAKKLFFDNLPNTAFAISNIDDKRGMVMLQNTKATKYSYGLKNLADFKGKIIENNITGLIINVDSTEVHCRMIGEFNAYNFVAVYGVAVALGINKNEALQELSNITGAEGRFDYIQSTHENILGIVDYAHTPDALLNVLATINKLKKGNEKVLTLIGCGGNRDTSKRAIMALVACEHSDKIIFTSDNPRNEEAEKIIKEMEAGVPVNLQKKCLSITDRREAIKTICTLANAGDIILIAGKGHEKYQEIKGVKYPFDDKEILQTTFNLLEK